VCRFTALVFDRLTPDARHVAIEAAKSYLGDKKETANYIGVFGIDLSLKSYAPFTRNADELRKAISSIENRASTSFGVDKDRLDAVQRMADAAQQSSDSADRGRRSWRCCGRGLLLGHRAARVDGSPDAERVRSARTRRSRLLQVNALYAMIGAMRSMPGRKSIVLFSEGVAIPPPSSGCSWV
jgi:hypothetical protein